MGSYLRMIAVVALALALIAAGAGPAAAKKKKIATEVTFPSLFPDNPAADYIGVSGNIESKNESCILFRKVQVFREAGATDVLVAETKTGDTYHFFPDVIIQPRPASGTQFYISVPKKKLSKKKVCLGTVSAVLTVP